MNEFSRGYTAAATDAMEICRVYLESESITGIGRKALEQLSDGIRGAAKVVEENDRTEAPTLYFCGPFRNDIRV
jgi:hypothetical protein